MNISNYTIRQARQEMKPLSLGYHGNIVDLWLVCNFYLSLVLIIF